MNYSYTRNLITAAVFALFALLGLLSLYTGSKMLTASFAITTALAILAVLDMRGPRNDGTRRQPKSRLHA